MLTLAGLSVHAQSTLQEYIALAKTNSPLINDNRNQVVANQAEAERIKAIYQKLQLSLNANYLLAPVYVTDNGPNHIALNPSGATNYYGYDLGITNGGNYQALVSINQPLFNNKRADLMAGQSMVNAQISANNIKLTNHELEKTITDQYLLCLLDRKQTQNAEDNIKLINKQQIIVKKLVAASLLKSSDLTLLNIEYENIVNVSITYEAAYHKDLLELKLMSGVRDTTINELDSLNLTLKDIEPGYSAYTEKFRLDSVNLVAGQKAFETKYSPQLGLFGNTGLNGPYLPTLGNRFGLSAGLTLTWNILDGHQREINRRKTNALLQSVSFYKTNFQTQKSLRKVQIIDELQSYDSRLKHAKQQLNEYESLLAGYRKQVIQAQLSVIDFVNVLKNRTTVQRDLLQLETNRLLLINAYNYWNW
jgi:outer membrane protein TolC